MANAVLSPYEEERELNIQRNKAMLVTLGLMDEPLSSKQPRLVRRQVLAPSCQRRSPRLMEIPARLPASSDSIGGGPVRTGC